MIVSTVSLKKNMFTGGENPQTYIMLSKYCNIKLRDAGSSLSWDNAAIYWFAVKKKKTILPHKQIKTWMFPSEEILVHLLL